MKLHFTTLDVFTTCRYSGNPLAIVQVSAAARDRLSQSQKQKIAAEFNLSETVFLYSQEGESGNNRELSIEIFTIETELPFAGHPTVGTAYFLLNNLGHSTETLIEKVGRIPIRLDTATGEAIVDVPHEFHIHEITYKSAWADSPGVCVSIVRGMSFVLVELPDISRLAEAYGTLNKSSETMSLDEGWRKGFMATMYFVAQGCDATGKKCYRTRMFTEWMEDPGTGAASCALACWLASKEVNAQSFRFAFTQGVEMGRRNDISVEVTKTPEGDDIRTVALGGIAVKVMEGILEM
jgi:predicted PhzF superfamily epimerase YddE/YHI9